METLGVLVGPWSVGAIRAASSSVIWAARSGLVTTPVKNPRSSATVHQHRVKDDECASGDPTGNARDIPRTKSLEDHQDASHFLMFPPLVSLDAIEMSPSGRTVVVGGKNAGGMSHLMWKKWPLVKNSPPHTLMSGHIIYHIEFSFKGDYLGVLSVPGSKKTDARDEDRDGELMLTLWKWPMEDDDGGTSRFPMQVSRDLGETADVSDARDKSQDTPVTCPEQLLVTALPQLKPQQVYRMSLSRGLPDKIIAAMIATEDELSVWQVTNGPLGQRVQMSTIGFGLMTPDRVYSMYCLATDAFALGVGGGWVVVGVDGELRVWLGGGGCRPCHQGPVTDLQLYGSHLYTVGGDGWLRVWEAETLEEAAIKATGSDLLRRGWSETSVTKAWLQLLREIHVHKGPGFPVTLLPFIRHNTAWIIQTNTGVIYAVWEGDWHNCVLHQGPSGSVSGVAMAPNHPLVATTTHHRYLQVAALPQRLSESSVNDDADRRIIVPTTIAQAEVPGSPQCVTWAICQVAEDDNLLVVGLEDGSVILYLLHASLKTSNTQLTLVQTERPHESPVVYVTASQRYEPENSGRMSLVITASEDCRIFIFHLTRAGKVTKLEPFGFHQLGAVPDRVEIKETVILVEQRDGLALEIPISSVQDKIESSEISVTGEASTVGHRESPDSWLLQQHSDCKEVWKGSTIVRKELLEEVAQGYWPGEHHTLILTVPSLDGKTMLGVTSLGQVVHLHQSQESYSIRLSKEPSVSPQRSSVSPRRSYKTLRAGDIPREEQKSASDLRISSLSPISMRQSDHTALLYGERPSSVLSDVSQDEEPEVKSDLGSRRNVIGCLSKDGMWIAAWVEGNDLTLYCARGSSFSSSSSCDLQLRQVGIRGVVIAEPGPSLEQRAQKEAGERLKVAMEEAASLLQQKLSKLKWDFRKVSLRADQLEGGQQLLEDLPLHAVITSSLNAQTTQNMNKVVRGSSYEIERLEVLLGKLRTLYSWNPVVSSLVVKAFGSDKELLEVNFSEEVYALLTKLAQVRATSIDETSGAAATVSEVRNLLTYWLESIRSGQTGKDRKNQENQESKVPETNRSNQKFVLTTEGVKAENEQFPGDNAPPGSRDDATSEEDNERDSLASLQAQVREVVGRVGAAGRGVGGEGGLSEADLDVGRELKWRRTAFNRLEGYRAREDARSSQLTSYKIEHNLPLTNEGDDGNGKGMQGEEDHDQVIKDEVTVPPASVTVEEVENKLWSLLGRVEVESKRSKERLQDAAEAQSAVLQQVNLHRAEWGHPSLNLTHQQLHLSVKISDELVNEFYCDLLDLDGPLETSGRLGADNSTQRGTNTSRRTKSSPRMPPTEADKRSSFHNVKRDSEGTDVPPLSLAGSPRLAKSSKTPQTGTTSRSLTTSRSVRTGRTGATTTRTPKTLYSGKGRKSGRYSPNPTPMPRPPMSLDQVQQIQRRRIGYLTELSQIPEAVQDTGKDADRILDDIARQVVDERWRLAWAVLQAGQLVKTVAVRVHYRDTEKKLRMSLRERLKERQVVKEKVLALRKRIQDYDHELECLVELEGEVERAFSHLVTDNAQFEVQLTRYFESRTTPGPAHRQSVSSSSEGGDSDGNDEGDDSGDNDSGLGTDEARMDENGPRPPGCDPAVFSLVTLLRDLRWRVAGTVEKSRRERTGEERRHAAVLRRLVRATHLTHSALSSLTTLQNNREKELGAIPSVVWLRKSQTSGDLGTVTVLPYPNTQPDSLAAVQWPQEGKCASANLLTKEHLQQLEQQLSKAKKAQELAIRKHRESRTERRSLNKQINELRQELASLEQTYQVTRACKLGMGAQAGLEDVKAKLETELDLRWPGKVASQMNRHENNINQLQKDAAGRTRELRALQKEEAALAAHILALRQEKDHLLYHLAQASSYSASVKGKSSKSGGRIMGQVGELDRLRAFVSQQDTTISALRHEISALRNKMGSVTLPGVPQLPPSKVRPSSSLPERTPTATHRSDHTFGYATSTQPTSATDSSDVYEEEGAEEGTFFSGEDEDGENDDDDNSGNDIVEEEDDDSNDDSKGDSDK